MKTLVIKINNKKTFKDIITYGLNILFVGLNPSPVSIEKGHYHQGRLGKRFWARLKQFNILKNSQDDKEDESLLENGYGITDLVKRPARTATLLTKMDFRKGRKELQKKILNYKPKIICFIYKKAAEEFLQRKISGSGRIDGEQHNTIMFLLPSMYAKKLEVETKMKELKILLS